MKTKRLVTDAMLVAMCFVLDLISIDLPQIKITFGGLPILIGAALFGPVDGLLIGLLGGFLSQATGPYGLTVTTPLWILPWGARGLTVGLYAWRHKYKMTRLQTVMIVVISSIIVTGLTTIVWYIDSRVFGYAYIAFAWITLVRFGVGIFTAIVFSLVLPPLLKILRNQVLAKKTPA